MAFEAANVAERFSADVMVLDLDVKLALGQHPLDDLERPDRSYHVIITVDLPETIDPDRPLLTVVSRHDRAALVRALARLTDERGPERRRGPQVPRDLPKETGKLNSPDVFFSALSLARPGDAVMMVTVADRTALDRLAQVCSEQVRVTDYVLRQSTEVVMFMPDGDSESGRAALARIEGQWPNAADLKVRFSVLGDLPAAELFSAELRALRSDDRPAESHG